MHNEDLKTRLTNLVNELIVSGRTINDPNPVVTQIYRLFSIYGWSSKHKESAELKRARDKAKKANQQAEKLRRITKGSTYGNQQTRLADAIRDTEWRRDTLRDALNMVREPPLDELAEAWELGRESGDLGYRRDDNPYIARARAKKSGEDNDHYQER